MEEPRQVGGVAKLARMRANQVEEALARLRAARAAVDERERDLTLLEEWQERVARDARRPWTRACAQATAAALEALLLAHRRTAEARGLVRKAREHVDACREDVERLRAAQRAAEQVARERQLALGVWNESREQEQVEETFRHVSRGCAPDPLLARG
jgi:hypothetical protein